MATKSIKTWIPMDQCVNGGTYLISARNASVGVWCKDRRLFYVRRHKMGDVFIDQEFHWDTGAPYGTAKPLLLVEMSPEIKSSIGWIEYLEGHTEKCEKLLIKIIKNGGVIGQEEKPSKDPGKTFTPGHFQRESKIQERDSGDKTEGA